MQMQAQIFNPFENSKSIIVFTFLIKAKECKYMYAFCQLIICHVKGTNSASC